MGLNITFSWIDWLVVVALLGATTLAGYYLSRAHQSYADFFHGGRRLPWWAVSASIVSAQLSGTTFIALPLMSYRDGGNLTFCLLLLGALISRVIVAWWVIPKLYAGNYDSVYQLVRRRLGPGGERGLSYLYIVSCLLQESGRLFAFALPVRVLLDTPLTYLASHTGIDALVWAVVLIGALSALWTMMGGIITVVWTDVIMTALFTIGALAIIAVLALKIDGGLAAAWATAGAAGKTRLWELSLDPTITFTLWVGLLASSWGGLGALLADQSVAQKLLCCRNANQARLALVSSWAGAIVPIACVLIGVLLWAFHQQRPMDAAELALVAQRADYVFPIFIGTQLPVGLGGLVIASVIAAAVPTSTLSGLSQLTMNLLPARISGLIAGETDLQSDRRRVRLSRWCVLGWTVALCLMTQVFAFAATHFKTIMDTAYTLSGQVGGAMLGAFLLAWFTRTPVQPTTRGYAFAAALSVLIIFGISFHEPWSLPTVGVASTLLLAVWCWVVRRDLATGHTIHLQTAALALGCLAALAACKWGYWLSPTGRPISLAATWYITLGSLITLAWGWALDRRTVAVVAANEFVTPPVAQTKPI